MPRETFLRPKRMHAPDFIIPKVTQLPEILHQCGWRPVHAHAAAAWCRCRCEGCWHVVWAARG